MTRRNTLPWLIAALALLLAGFAHAARAHPVDQLEQVAYLTVGADAVTLELTLQAGAEVAAPVLTALDPNGDGAITPTEAQAFGVDVLGQVGLMIDGAPTMFELAYVTPAPMALLATGNGPIQISARASVTQIPTEVGFVSDFMPAPTIGSVNMFTDTALGAAGWRLGALERTDAGLALRATLVPPTITD